MSTPAPDPKNYTDAQKLMVLNQIARAKARNESIKAVWEEHNVTIGFANAWRRLLKSGELKPNKGRHPFLVKQMNEERLRNFQQGTKGKANGRANGRSKRVQRAPRQPAPANGVHALASSIEEMEAQNERMHQVITSALQVANEALADKA